MPPNLIIIFQVQIDRIKAKPTPHATGPKKPTLGELEARLSK